MYEEHIALFCSECYFLYVYLFNMSDYETILNPIDPCTILLFID